LDELLEERPGPGGAGVFLDERDVSEIAMGGVAGFVTGQSLFLPFFGFLIEMKLEFFAKVVFLLAALPQPGQLAKEGVHLAS
jgi:hypothetical protein